MAENLPLELLKAQHLRLICKDLSIKTCGSKLDLLTRIRLFLSSDEGKLKAYLRLNKTNLSTLFNDPNPLLTLGIIYRPAESAKSMIDPPSDTTLMESRYRTEIRCICVQGVLPGLPCSSCKRIQHIRCMGQNAHMQTYVCPLCQLLKIDLCAIPDLPPLVHPFALSRANPNITHKNMDRLIRISQEMMTEIDANPEKIRVEIRCLRLDGKGFANNWPTKAKVKVNNEEVLCIPDTVYFKVQKGPLDITGKVRIGDNVMSFYKYEDPEYYAAAVFVVRTTSAEQIIQQTLSLSPHLSFAEGLQNVIKSITSDEDLSQDSTPVSLKCPISLTYIQTAVRGTACTHIQCYDLATFIIIFGKNSQCPECGKMVTSFVVDDFVTEMARKAEEKGAFTVYIHRDGNYTFLTESPEREEIDASDVEDGEIVFVKACPKKEEDGFRTVTIDLDATKTAVRRPTIDLEGGGQPVVVDIEDS